MPVAKKTTANNKTNKTKKVSLIQKLKLNTLKGKMLATVLIFALIGGGVMVYKSFAATSTFSVWCSPMPQGPSVSSIGNECFEF